MIVGRGVDKASRGEGDHRKSAVPVEMLSADLGNVEDVHSIIHAADKRFGRVDILVNAAGPTDRGNLLNTTPELFDRMFAVNTRAPFFLIQDAAKVMIREGIEGRIVNVGSVSGLGGQPFLAPISGSKGALATPTRHAGFSLMRHNDLRRSTRHRLDDLGQRARAGAVENRRSRLYRSCRRLEALRPDPRPERGRARRPSMASDDSGMMTGAVIPFDQSVYGGYDDAPTPASQAGAMTCARSKDPGSSSHNSPPTPLPIIPCDPWRSGRRTRASRARRSPPGTRA